MKERLEKLLENSYAPYSNMHFACIVETKSGNFYEGVNIENASYGATICAERNAIHTMITNGESQIDRIVCIDSIGNAGAPCGACRELIMQLDKDSKDIKFLMNANTYEYVTMKELVPNWWGYDRFENEKEQ